MKIEVNDLVICKCGCKMQGKVLKVTEEDLILWDYKKELQHILGIRSAKMVMKASKLSKVLE